MSSEMDVRESNAIYRAAQVLAGHFGMRPWIDMARDRGELRRKVRDKHFDPNEPTADDCLLAFQDALKTYQAALSVHKDTSDGGEGPSTP